MLLPVASLNEKLALRVLKKGINTMIRCALIREKKQTQALYLPIASKLSLFTCHIESNLWN
jgi:hypothetical protein